MDYNNKKYGLILPKKQSSLIKKKMQSSALKPRLSVFENNSSSDDDGQKEVNAEIHKEAIKKIVKKQTKLEIQKALEEDATVYEYDSIYDDMKSEANKKNIPKRVEIADAHKKPKYIGSLMKAAQQRSRDKQRVEERKIEKERKNEGGEFADKAQFVTSAYRKRMQERQEEEEEERRMAAIEDAMNVKKQKDLSGFYKHLLRQQVGEETIPGESSVENNLKNSVEEADQKNEDDRDTDLSFSSSESEVEVSETRSCSISPPPGKNSKERNARKDLDRSLKRHQRRKGNCDEHSDSDYREQPSRRKSSSSRNRRDKYSSSTIPHKTNRAGRRLSSDNDPKRNVDRSTEQRHKDDKSSTRLSETRHNHRDYDRKHKTSEDRVRDNSPKSKVAKPSIETLDKAESSADGKSDGSDKFTKRTNAESAMSARERYLARKKASKSVRAPVEDSD